MQQTFTTLQALCLFALAGIWTIAIISLIYYFKLTLPFSYEILIHGGIIGIIVLFMSYQQRNKPPSPLSKDLQQVKVSGRFIFIALGVGLSLWLLDTAYSVVFLQTDIPAQATELIAQANQVGYVSTTLAVCLLAPLMEEMLFRGVLLPAFAYQDKAYIGVISSAILFSLIHFSAEQALILFIAGLCFGVLRVKSNSTWPPFIAHTVNNSLTWWVYSGMV